MPTRSRGSVNSGTKSNRNRLPIGLLWGVGAACYLATCLALAMATFDDPGWPATRIALAAACVSVPLFSGWLVLARAQGRARLADLQAVELTLAREVAQRESADAALLDLRKHADAVERELASANARLAEAHQTASLAGEASRAKSDFLAMTSHEIRTPLSGVIGFAQLLAESPLSTEQKDWVDTIQSAGQTLLMLINDVLDLSKIEAGRMTLESIPFNPAAAARDVVAVLSAQAARKGIDLQLNVASTVPDRTLGDLIRYKQVLFNLLGNAVKFTAQGCIEVHLRWSNGEGTAGTLHTAIQDTGIGIARELQGRLFESFRQADTSTARRFGGTGLGLAICKNLVEFQGGRIGLSSEPDRGSTFWFELPSAIAHAGSESADFRAAPPFSTQTDLSRRLSVLLAEDIAINQKLAVNLLQKQGCDVQVAQNGQEAVEMSGRHRFDLIFMDCQMPEMDGFEAAKEIRRMEASTGLARGHKRPGRLPIVAMTANALQGDREACLEAGMDDYISKPYRPDDLARALSRWTRAGLKAAA